MKRVFVEKNRFVDSVSLMSVRDKGLEIEGIEYVEVVMGTPPNLETLKSMGFDVEDATSNDLVIAVSALDNSILERAVELIKTLINKGLEEETKCSSLEDVESTELFRDIVQISLPGEYACEEAKNALDRNLDVFIFSDNVSLEDELKLKENGRERGLLVMGPDCGVGLIDGIALAAGSIVNKGPIGIVSASGSGAQEVSCIVEKCGIGVSRILGTGGHDLYPEIGGITMIECIKRLEEDEETEVIILVSKLADLKVMDKVLNFADSISKPTVAVFLGGNTQLFEGHKVIGAYSLEEAALRAVKIIKGEEFSLGFSEEEFNEIIKNEILKYNDNQKYLRALYCGGTFTEEALIYFSKNNDNSKFYTNLKNKYAEKLEDYHESFGHTILDLGSEEFTAEAPHPVFDPELRLKRFRKEVASDDVAVVLIDFITGPGVHEDPITPFVSALNELKKERNTKLTIISNICGSYEDPQNIRGKEKLMKDAGIIVTKSNYESARLASAIVKELEKRESNER